MDSLKSALAVLLCGVLSTPTPYGTAQTAEASDTAKPPHRSAYQSAQLQGDERILHALNRFTFGPRPGDVEAVRAMGLDKWFEQQLNPASIDETELNARLAQFPAMQWSTQNLLYRIPSNAMIRQAMNGRGTIPQSNILHAVYEDQIYRFQEKRADQAEKKADQGASAPNQATAGSSVNQATSPTMNGDATMQGGAAMNASVSSAIILNQLDQLSTTADLNATTNQGADAQSAKNRAADSMTAATGTAANAPNQDRVSDMPADANQALVSDILNLPPRQRVAQLAAMEPPAFESFIRSLRGPQRIKLNADLSPELKETVADLENPQRLVVAELISQRLARDIYSNAQLQEVMTDFWLNHFNVFLHKNEETPYYLVSYERDVIRPLALGKFEDLLEAVAHSPAMMLYLDNAESIGPDSPAAERAKMSAARNGNKKAPEGINENYARELMELHTLGVNGGYTQADVIQAARVLTGWTVDQPQRGGGFTFNPNRHEPGSKKVLGKKIKENGEKEGEELLHLLVTRPATAQFLSRKLAMRFVSDDPPQSLVDRMAKSYLSSHGDISAVLRTLFRSPEFWSTGDYRAKVKTPLEFVVSAARASNAQIDNYQPLENALRQMGMLPYGCIPPTGYKWDAADWVSTGALVDRMNFALNLAANRLPGITVTWASSSLSGNMAADADVPSPESEETRLEPLVVAGGVSAATRSAALQQFQLQSAQENNSVRPVAATNRPFNRNRAVTALERQDQLLAGLLIGSPEFQRR
ncbi:MAG TPA: DUF1800 family protein [Terracidiphilus sp.]|nr:DUF1800 family protein [Terracidiphilus sp.]